MWSGESAPVITAPPIALVKMLSPPPSAVICLAAHVSATQFPSPRGGGATYICGGHLRAHGGWEGRGTLTLFTVCRLSELCSNDRPGVRAFVQLLAYKRSRKKFGKRAPMSQHLSWEKDFLAEIRSKMVFFHEKCHAACIHKMGVLFSSFCSMQIIRK